jgi:UDP-GlcNAc3NAcA epimerase
LKLLTIVGARPQFIKAAVVSRALARYATMPGQPRITEVLVHTGQHFDFNMSGQFFNDLGLPKPAYHLGIGGLGHGAMTGRMLEKIDDILRQERPNALLVYGDTNSTLAGALAAVKRHVPVGHVEAGVRSYNRRMPEEINRMLTDQISRWLFCPSLTAAENLRREGIESCSTVSVTVVGDVMFDVWLAYRSERRSTPALEELIERLRPGYYLATVHREENTTGGDGAERLFAIISTLDRIAQLTPVVMPVHPRIRASIAQLSPKHMHLIEPVSYFDMMCLLERCNAVITDSGGLQKEAYFAGKPCITLREETEWTELVAERCSILVGAEPSRLMDAEQRVRDGVIAVTDRHLYGHGDAASRIVEMLAAAPECVQS